MNAMHGKIRQIIPHTIHVEMQRSLLQFDDVNDLLKSFHLDAVWHGNHCRLGLAVLQLQPLRNYSDSPMCCNSKKLYNTMRLFVVGSYFLWLQVSELLCKMAWPQQQSVYIAHIAVSESHTNSMQFQLHAASRCILEEMCAAVLHRLWPAQSLY